MGARRRCEAQSPVRAFRLSGQHLRRHARSLQRFHHAAGTGRHPCAGARDVRPRGAVSAGHGGGDRRKAPRDRGVFPHQRDERRRPPRQKADRGAARLVREGRGRAGAAREKVRSRRAHFRLPRRAGQPLRGPAERLHRGPLAAHRRGRPLLGRGRSQDLPRHEDLRSSGRGRQLLRDRRHRL